jgi:hypothetical protein
MFPYRELAGERKFRCTDCGRVKRVKYVPVSDLCRRCAARKVAEAKRSVPSIPITLAENLVVTEAVEKRLRKKAQSDIPSTRAEKLGDLISKWCILVFWASAYFVARAIFQEFSSLFWLVLLGWALGGPLAVMYAIDLFLAKPRKERAEQIVLRLVELAEARKRVIEEALRFYSSPEWTIIRKQVIKEEGRVCEECGKRIKNDFDITVDHKRPRSKYPDIALDRENLRILCRTCNSKKGARLPDW